MSVCFPSQLAVEWFVDKVAKIINYYVVVREAVKVEKKV